MSVHSLCVRPRIYPLSIYGYFYLCFLGVMCLASLEVEDLGIFSVKGNSS